MDKRELFEKVPVPKALATLAIPTIISQLISMIYNLADTFFIGMAENSSMTAASSIGFTLVFMMNCIPNLFGVGGGSLISRLMGVKKNKEAAYVSSFSFYGTLIVSAIYSVFILLFMDSILPVIGASGETLVYAKQYTFWVVVVGAVPAALAMTMSHLLRSEGMARQASFGLGLGGVLNIILDPIFMFVILDEGQEVLGASIATMLSNIIAFCYFMIIYLVTSKKTIISLDPRKVIPEKQHISMVFAVGVPAALGSFLACVSNMIINGLASEYTRMMNDPTLGAAPVAAIGIAKKIDMLPMNVGFGLCQGMMPLVAYNFASGDHRRMRAVSRTARNAAMIFAGVCIIVFQIFAHKIAVVFNPDPMTSEYATRFLRILCLAVPFMLFNLHISFSLQAMGMGKQALFLSSLRQGLINIPLLLLMYHFFKLDGIVWTQLISDALTGVISYAVYRSSLKKLSTAKVDEDYGE